MRAILVCLLTAFALAAPASDALAGRPVFVVVPSESSLDSAIHRQIADDARTLRRVNGRAQLLAATAQRLQAKLQVAADPFEFEDALMSVRNQLAATEMRASVLRSSIRRLRNALRPVRLPRTSAPSGAPGSLGWNAVSIAEHYLGVRYLWGGSNPGVGFDCSGFVKYVYERLGLTLPHYAATQFRKTPRTDPNRLEAGDLVFFEPRADGPGHVGIYVGYGQLIEAPHSGDVVKLAPLAALSASLGFVGATRPADILR